MSFMVVSTVMPLSAAKVPSTLTVIDGEEPLLETSESWAMDNGTVDVIEGDAEFPNGPVRRGVILLRPSLLVSNCYSIDSRILDGSAQE